MPSHMVLRTQLSILVELATTAFILQEEFLLIIYSDSDEDHACVYLFIALLRTTYLGTVAS